MSKKNKFLGFPKFVKQHINNPDVNSGISMRYTCYQIDTPDKIIAEWYCVKAITEGEKINYSYKL